MIISTPKKNIQKQACCVKFLNFTYQSGFDFFTVNLVEDTYMIDLVSSNVPLDEVEFKITNTDNPIELNATASISLDDLKAIPMIEAGKFLTAIFLNPTSTAFLLLDYASLDEEISPCAHFYNSQPLLGTIPYLAFSVRKINPDFSDYNLLVFDNNDLMHSARVFFDANGETSLSSPVTPFIGSVPQPNTTFGAWLTSRGITNFSTNRIRVGEWSSQAISSVKATQTTNSARPFLIQDPSFGNKWKIRFEGNQVLNTPNLGPATGFNYNSISMFVLCRSNFSMPNSGSYSSINERIVAKILLGASTTPPAPTGVAGQIRELGIVGLGFSAPAVHFQNLFGTGTNSYNPNNDEVSSKELGNYAVFLENQNPNGTGYVVPVANNQPIIPYITNVSGERTATLAWNTLNGTTNIPISTAPNTARREHIVAFSLDLQTKIIKLYLNGYLEHTVPNMSTDKTNAPISIGANPDAAGGYVGNIAEVRIYDSSLGDAQVVAVTRNIRDYFNVQNVK